MKTLKNMLKGLLIFAAILLIWHLLCKIELWSAYILPGPQKVFETMLSMFRSGELVTGILVSLRRVIIGFLLSFILAFLFALLSAIFPKLSPYYRQILGVIRHIPPISLIPLLILWFGIGEAPKLIVIVLASFFPILLNADSGLEGCDKRLLEVGKSLGFSKAKRFFRIMLPAAVPDILVGMRIGLGYSWRAIVGAEMIAAANGLGYLILDAQTLSRTDKVIAGIIVIGFIGTMTDWIFKCIIRLASHGREGSELHG